MPRCLPIALAVALAPAAALVALLASRSHLRRFPWCDLPAFLEVAINQHIANMLVPDFKVLGDFGSFVTGIVKRAYLGRFCRKTFNDLLG